MRNSFLEVIDDPTAKARKEFYAGWTSPEIAELYYVLYGEKLMGNEEVVSDYQKQMSARANLSSPKVKKKFENHYLPMFEIGDSQFVQGELEKARNDFLNLVSGEAEEIANTYYQGWTKEEFSELYFVLYGEVA
jgi:hypothetical protein